MAFIRTKTIRGKTYRYKVESYRDEAGKVRQKQTYLGRAQGYAADDARGQEKERIAAKLRESCPPFPTGKYEAIAIDPPWQYHLRERDRTHRNRTPYPNLTLKDIKALPVEDLAADIGYLFLWVTKDYLEAGFECLRAWGFEFKQVFTWIKMTQDGTKIRFGAGHWGRNCTEFFLVGTRGKPKAFKTLGITKNPNVIEAPRTKHSTKPEQFYQLVERVSSNRLEMFARSHRDGWESWGGEI